MSDEKNTMNNSLVHFDADVLKGLSPVMIKALDVLQRMGGAPFVRWYLSRRGQGEAAAMEAKGNAAIRLAQQGASVALTKNDYLIKVAALDSTPAEEWSIEQRTIAVIAHREQLNQLNIEAIAGHAMAELESGDEKPLSTLDPGSNVTDDWLNRFYDDARLISDPQMQAVWGKVLAGEIQAPGSFSFQTLDIVRNLTQEDALTFQKAVNLMVVPSVYAALIIRGEDSGVFQKSFNLFFPDYVRLMNLGLISPTENAHFIRRQLSKGESSHIQIGNTLLQLVAQRNAAQKDIPCLIVSEAGRELAQLSTAEPSEDYVKFVAEQLWSPEIEIGRATITSETDFNYEYDEMQVMMPATPDDEGERDNRNDED